MDASAGGMPVEATVTCPDGYASWFSSSFSFPDGAIVGTADFPSMPWSKTGALNIDVGRLTGVGTAVASQGVSFPYAGSRLRFRVRFTDSKQQATVAFNSAKDGTGGVRVSVDAAGKLSLSEGKVVAEEVEIAPLETGLDWFVEGVFEGAAAKITLARTDYASDPTGKLHGMLSTDVLQVDAGGTKTAAQLVSDAGISPAIDDISFERCGVEPPEYEPQFADTFERADSSNIGSAELPATSQWRKGEYGTATITNGSLEIGGLASVDADQDKQLALEGLRMRIAFSTKDVNSWLSFYFNTPSTTHAATDLGFWAWGDTKGVYIGVFAGDRKPESLHPELKFSAGAMFYAELNVDSGVGVLTLRSGSFAGPIVAIDDETGLLPTAGKLLMLKTDNGFVEKGTLVEDLTVDSYAP